MSTTEDFSLMNKHSPNRNTPRRESSKGFINGGLEKRITIHES